MYYAIVPCSGAYSFFKCESLEGLIEHVNVDAFVYSTPTQLSQFCDKQMLREVKQVFSVYEVRSVCEFVHERARHIKLEEDMSKFRTVKQLTKGKDIDGREGTRRHQALTILQKSKTTEEALEKIIALGVSDGRAKELIRYGIAEGYVQVEG